MHAYSHASWARVSIHRFVYLQRLPIRTGTQHRQAALFSRAALPDLFSHSVRHFPPSVHFHPVTEPCDTANTWLGAQDK
jgi:hypothetical protein